jgi:hypothetical protein
MVAASPIWLFRTRGEMPALIGRWRFAAVMPSIMEGNN